MQVVYGLFLFWTRHSQYLKTFIRLVTSNSSDNILKHNLENMITT